jgi:penicillin-binding protein 1C
MSPFLLAIFSTLVRHRYRLALALLALLAGFLLFDRLYPLSTELTYSRIILSSDSVPLHSFLNQQDKWRMKTELHEISPELRKAFIYKEDRFFYYHPGINPLALLRASFQNIFHLKKTSGASTISMQVVRLLEPRPRTYLSKLIEVVRTLQLELHHSKEEILALYLNLVPYGGNIEGVKAASLLYFDRMPDKLSLAQITTLTIIPNKPTSLALGKHNDAIVKQRNKWLQRFEQEAIFSAQAIADALDEPLDAGRKTRPSIAPHFSYFIHRNASPSEANVYTSIRADVQHKVEDISRYFVKRLHAVNIHNASVLVVDNTSRQVVAYLGSPDFADNRNAGQVDGVRAWRSPGSALKPFIYAQAIDAGAITARSILHDVPIDIDGYTPENYNKEFNGMVSAEKALASSLNIPAVRLLHSLGVRSLTDMLHKAGFRQISKDQNKLGLSLALGGCGVNLAEMAGLYAALANAGQFAPIRYHNDLSPVKTQSLFSPEAAFIVTDILSKVERPELPPDFDQNPDIPKIAWKTGTSYGRRDAWSIGFNARYTIAVWVGNFSGEGSPELTGAGIATPLLFRLFNAIDYRSPALWFNPPETLKTRTVCTESGLPPSDFCTSLATDYFIPGLSSIEQCQHLRYVLVNPGEQHSYCLHCLPETGYKRKLYPNTASEILAFMRSKHLEPEGPPPHNPACQHLFVDNAPLIVSPADGREYLSPDNEAVELLLQCQAANDVSKVYWYINNRLYKEALVSDKVFFKPDRGRTKISCSDEKGRNTDIFIKVR